MSRDGLLYVLSEPGQVSEAEFHDWYDREHAPARMALPRFHRGARYRSADDQKPTWLACYELDLTVLDTPEYQVLRTNRSPREQQILSHLETIDRRVYELIDDHRIEDHRIDDYRIDDRSKESDSPAPVLVCLARTSADEDSLDEWYRLEQLPLLRDTEGWRRTIRGRLVAGAGPGRITVHEIDHAEVFATDAYLRAVRTARRDRVMRSVTEQERRVFRHHRTLPPGG